MYFMFIILIYVFPVSFLTRSLVHWLTDAALPGVGLLPYQIRSVYGIFGAGFALLSIIFVIQYARAGYFGGSAGSYLPHRFVPIARRSSQFWAIWSIAAMLSMMIANLGALSQLIWSPLLPYGMAMVVVVAWQLWSPIAPQRPMDDNDVAEMEAIFQSQ